MEGLSGDLDYLSDDVAQTELDEWLQTTDVFEQDVERPTPQEVTAPPPVQQPKRHDFKHKSSLEHVRCEKDVFEMDFQTALREADRKVGAGTQNSYVSSASSLCSKSQSQTYTSPQPVIDVTATEPTTRRNFDHKSLEYTRSKKDVFGIDFPTALRAASDHHGKVGRELPSSDFDKTHHSRVSSVSSLCSKSLTSISPQPVIDLTANEPTLIDLTTTDALPQPSTPCKRARRTFDSNINIEQMLTLMGKPLSSSDAATVARAKHNFLERTKSCPPTRRSSVDSTESNNSWQKLSHLDSRARSFPESMPINNWQKKSHQDSRRISLPGLPQTSSKDSSPSRSFFHKMDEHSTQFHRMMSSSSTASNVRDCTTSTSDSIMGTKSYFNVLQGAMEQTQQSRRMIIGAISSDGTRSDDVASSAHVATSAVKKTTEFGTQFGQGGVAGLPNPSMNSSDATRTNVVTKAEAEAKRNLECIAREQMILEKRLAEMNRRFAR